MTGVGQRELATVRCEQQWSLANLATAAEELRELEHAELMRNISPTNLAVSGKPLSVELALEEERFSLATSIAAFCEQASELLPLLLAALPVQEWKYYSDANHILVKRLAVFGLQQPLGIAQLHHRPPFRQLLQQKKIC